MSKNLIGYGLLASVLALFATMAYGQKVAGSFAPVRDETRLRKIIVDHSQLRDPFSVQFRKLEYQEEKRDDGKINKVWCGQLNAKNAVGGYVGWSDFVVSEAPSSAPFVTIVEGKHAEIGKIMIDALCKGSAIGPPTAEPAG